MVGDGGSSVLAYLGIGSNMGDRMSHLDRAVSALGEFPGTRVLRVSPIYESKAWGRTEQPDFLNLVVEVSTVLEPRALLAYCKRIEREEGRVPGEPWGPRPLDVDILMYGDRGVDTEDLEIPHPRMWERRFVLLPLADLRPDLAGPDGMTIEATLQQNAITSQGVWPYASAGSTS
jgi:2-amino-4-hydroxy-6-hydroxymethyldihydropteridine diphosphokinase